MGQSKTVDDKHESSRSFTIIRSDNGRNAGVDPLQRIRVIRSRRIHSVCVLGNPLGFSFLWEELLQGIGHLVPDGPGSVTTDDDHVGVGSNQIGAMSDRCSFEGEHDKVHGY